MFPLLCLFFSKTERINGIIISLIKWIYVTGLYNIEHLAASQVRVAISVGMIISYRVIMGL